MLMTIETIMIIIHVDHRTPCLEITVSQHVFCVYSCRSQGLQTTDLTSCQAYSQPRTGLVVLRRKGRNLIDQSLPPCRPEVSSVTASEDC